MHLSIEAIGALEAKSHQTPTPVGQKNASNSQNFPTCDGEGGWGFNNY